MDTTTDHLNPDALALLHAPAPLRVGNVRLQRFVEYPAAQRIREEIDLMLEGPRSSRPRCLLISADSGAGKSSVMVHVGRRHPDREASGARSLRRPIVSCVVEPYPEISSMQRILLGQLGSPIVTGRGTDSGLNGMIVRYVTDLDTRVIFFDELQHLLHRTLRWQRILMDWLKFVSTATRVCIVGAGNGGVEALVEVDPQLASRFSVMRLPPWRTGNAFGAFLESYERTLPLRFPSRLWDLTMQKAILEETKALNTMAGVTDGVVRIIREAAIAAIVSGRERVTRDLLNAWRSPHVQLANSPG